MIDKRRAKSYCKEDVSKIENYDKAVNDKTQTCHCHHRDEVKVLPSGITVIRSKTDLIENGRYYNCPANELIFLTKAEHNSLHHKGDKGICSEFGKAFKEHYELTSCDNIKLYMKEYMFYKRHSKFSWEVN